MSPKRIYNFSAGPGVLPESVLVQAQEDMVNYKGIGLSVMEMSHRSKPFEAILSQAESALRRLMGIPDNYTVLFLQGGASLQFSMVPMNLYLENKPIDIVHTGVWSAKAIDELKKVAPYTVVASSEKEKFTHIPTVEASALNPDASYVHITSNNTIYGTQWSSQFLNTGEVPLVADMSSDILSRKIDISQFGLIYAGAQKNMGPAGVTVVIIRKDLLERTPSHLPTMLQYKVQAKNVSLYNTPPTYSIYILGLVLQWLEALGGIDAIEAHNELKAALLYEAIESSAFYYCPNVKACRSKMNVVFRIHGNQEDLETQFVSEASQQGLCELKGHRSVGGLRASLYNAQSIESVKALVAFMKEFERKH